VAAEYAYEKELGPEISGNHGDTPWTLEKVQGRCQTVLVGSDLERPNQAGKPSGVRDMATKDTGGGQQKATRSTEEVEEQAQDAQASEDLKERQEKLSDDVDSVLDEIDDVLEENAEDFVRSFVQKGGQ
jgi:ubiquitin-like protein Pup